MNVPADALYELAIASGAPVSHRAEGVVRWATERLRGDREWWVEVFNSSASVWELHSIRSDAAAALAAAERLTAMHPGSHYRAVELIRQVLKRPA